MYKKEDLKDLQPLEELVEESKGFIREALSMGVNPLIAYSGGKDGNVVAHLLSIFGVKEAVCDICFYFEKQIEDSKLSAKRMGLNCEFVDSLSLEWLSKNQEYLFTTETKLRGKFFKLRHQKTVRAHGEKLGSDIIFFGRRKQENTIKAPYYVKNKVVQCHPLSNWRLSHIWQYFEKNKLQVPWIYSTPFAKDEGNAPWIMNQAKKPRKTQWDIVYRTDPKTVERAAKYLDEARRYLNGELL